MTANKYQNKVAKILYAIFGEKLVKTEWDSVKYDSHFANHKLVYAPRIDIAVGPFNSYKDLDIGIDKAELMQSHPFTKELINRVFKHRETMDKIWNSISRCYLAIEIEFSGSSKHILGSIINASVSGSIAIIITSNNHFKKVNRISKYLMRLEGLERLEINTLRNLIIFKENEFLEFLQIFKDKNSEIK